MTAWHKAAGGQPLAVDCRIGNVETKRYRWFQTRATPVRDAAGRVLEWLGTSTDVDDLRQFQERQQVMVAELQHRTRNWNGVVRSIASETVRVSASLGEFEATLGDRLAALSRVQGLLSRSEKIGVAEAQSFPSVTLTASPVVNAIDPAKIFRGLSLQYMNIGPSISIPLFKGGRLKSNLVLQRAHQQEAAIAYQKAVLQGWHASSTRWPS